MVIAATRVNAIFDDERCDEDGWQMRRRFLEKGCSHGGSRQEEGGSKLCG